MQAAEVQNGQRSGQRAHCGTGRAWVKGWQINAIAHYCNLRAW